MDDSVKFVVDALKQSMPDLSADDAISILETDSDGEEREIAGAIFDPDEAKKFFAWLSDRMSQ